MPTIPHLPPAGTISASDLIPLSQGGVSRAVSIGRLLAATQPAIIVESASLLGRFSIGAGGPDSIAIGPGLSLNNGTLHAQSIGVSTLPVAQALAAGDQVVIANGTSANLLGINSFRGIFSAGTNIAIDPAGTISSTVPAGAGNTNFATLGPVAVLAGGDLIPVSQNGSNRAITYANLIDGLTIDQAQSAGVASDADSFWVGQASNVMSRQTLGALAPWIMGKLPSWKRAVVELQVNTTLDTTVHNNAIVICSQPIAISAIPANMGSGFTCEIINVSAGPVTLAGTITTSNGSGILAPAQSALVRCAIYSGGTLIFASISASAVPVQVPGQATNLTASSVSSTGVILSWVAPGTGGAASSYTVQSRVSGTTAWNTAGTATGTTSQQIAGLLAATNYDFSVIARNSSGSGIISAVLTVATSAAGIVPGAPTAVTVGNIATTSMTCAWNPPATGGAATGYAVQYRISGQTAWTVAAANLPGTSTSLTGLTPATSYDIRIIASNAIGTGPASGITTAITSSPAGLVTSITWNVAPGGTFAHGAGAIGVNVHVSPANATVEFGFSTSTTVAPGSWTVGQLVNTDLWGAYVPTPPTAGTWYAWAQGTDGSAVAIYPTPFTVT